VSTTRSRAHYTMADARTRAIKPRDSWWTVILVDPVAVRLSLVAVNYTRLTPNQISAASLALGLASAWFFWSGSATALIVGALLYHASFTMDCVDGKVARLAGTGSYFGEWLDYVFDRIRVLAVTLALMGGRFRLAGDERYLYLGMLVIFLDMLRYVDALKIESLQARLRKQVRDARREAGLKAGGIGAERGEEDRIQRAVARRFPLLSRVRNALGRRRIRSHLFSGIEFQMFVFILGPATGQVAVVTLAAAALLLAFEIAIVAKLFLASRATRRLVKRILKSRPAEGV